jgi:hypothetical protein
MFRVWKPEYPGMEFSKQSITLLASVKKPRETTVVHKGKLAGLWNLPDILT